MTQINLPSSEKKIGAKMSIQMSLLFAMLVLQMFALTFLVLPLPHSIRKPLLGLYVKLSLAREFQTVYYITNSLVLLQFIDSVRKVARLKTEHGDLQSTYTLDTDKMVRVFYNQRNLYISGMVLFLAIAIPTVFQIIRRLVKYQELKKNAPKPTDPDALKKQIEVLDKDISAFKKQKMGLEKQFEALTYQEKAIGDKKSD